MKRLRFRFVVAALAVLLLALASAAGASADGTYTFGPSGVTPTMDTANGDYYNSQTPDVTNNGTVCSGPILGENCSPQHNSITGDNPILPANPSDPTNAPHNAQDLGVWSTGYTAKQGGQVLAINLTGCAVEDSSAPSQESDGVAVNTVLFQTLTPSGSTYNVDNTSGQFLVPFCHNATNGSSATTKTVTTYNPLHMCINAGDLEAFHDIGGYVSDGTSSWYPQGIPMMVLAPVSGESTASFVGVGPTTYGAGVYGSGDSGDAMAGFNTEASQEVTMQIEVGTGNDAYGICPGGFGDEPANSNTIDCDYKASGDGSNTPNPTQYPDNPFCAGPGQPIPGSNLPGYVAPGSTSTTKSGTSGGTTTAVTAPVITKLTMNPPLYVAKRGAVITYIDSHPGYTTLRFYLVKGKKDKLVRTMHHQDKVKVGFHVYGLKPGNYVVKVSSAYEGKTSKTVSIKFRVILKR